MSAFTGTVAVTGLNATDNPGPGVAVAMALRAHPDFQGRIVGLTYDALDPGLYVRDLFDAAYLVPYPSTGRVAWFARLAQVVAAQGPLVLIPNLDSELPALMGQEDTLAAMGVKTLLPTRESFERRAKTRLHDLVRDGVPVPRSEVVNDPASLVTVHERLGTPLLVKGPFYGAEVAWHVDEAVAAFHRAAAKWGLPIIVQEHVDGEDVVVAAIGDGAGGLVGAVPMKKTLLTDKGKGWAGVVTRDPALLALSERVIAALRWRGPCEIEVRRDREGRLHLLEINPRFPAWIDLSAMAGQNLPMAAVRLAAGESLAPLPAYRVGTGFIRVAINVPLDMNDFAAVSTRGELPAAPEVP